MVGTQNLAEVTEAAETENASTNSIESEDITDITLNDDGTLTFTNLPVDGVTDEGRATLAQMVGITQLTGFDAYESDGTQAKHFAVYAQTDNLAAGAVGSGDYQDYGWGGAQLKRDAQPNLPSNRQANYSGTYAAVAVLPGDGGAGNVKFISGEVTMYVDFIDFENGSTPTAEGIIDNRWQYDVDDSTGASATPLGALSLGTGTFDEDGFISPADEQEFLEAPGGSATNVSEWQGLFAGPNGEELGGILIVDTVERGRERGVFTTTLDD